jgi:type VI protein secretion system component Hcp
MPTRARNANYTYHLTGAMVTKIQTSTLSSGTLLNTVTLQANPWTWDYQPADASGNPTGIAGHGSN